MEQQSAPDYSHWLTIATTIFLVWTILFVTARVFGKLTRNLSWALNDSVYSAALVRIAALRSQQPCCCVIADVELRLWESLNAALFTSLQNGTLETSI